jgi:hypothetical protein
MSNNTETRVDMRQLAQRINLGNQNMSLQWFELLAVTDNGAAAGPQTETTLCEKYCQKYRPHMTTSTTKGWMTNWLDIFRRNGVAQKVAAAEFQSETRWELTPLGRQLWAHCTTPSSEENDTANAAFRSRMCKLAIDGAAPVIRSCLERLDEDIANFKREAAAAGAPLSMALYVRIPHPELSAPRENDRHTAYVLSIDLDGSLPPQPPGDTARPVTRQERSGRRRRRRSSQASNNNFSVSVISHRRR